MTEWPLVLFTVALQASCGLALSAMLSDLASNCSDDDAMRPLGIAVFPLVAIGLAAALLHLGRPLSALRSLSNLGSSRLSLEILLSLLFAAAALVYGLTWWKRIARGRILAGAVTTLAGMAAVASSFTIYLIPTKPAWNSGWLPMSFLGAVLLFAGIAPLSLRKISRIRFLQGYLFLGLAGGLAHLVSAMWMLAGLSRTPADDFTAARLQDALQLVTGDHAVWLGLYLLFAAVLPVAFVIKRWPPGRNAATGPEPEARALGIEPLVFAAILAGVIIGRVLMYAMGASMPPF